MSRSIAAIKTAEARAAACGVTLAELHAAAGVHRATWNRWRMGASGPNLDQLTSVDELLSCRAAPSEEPGNGARRTFTPTHTPVPVRVPSPNGLMAAGRQSARSGCPFQQAKREKT